MRNLICLLCALCVSLIFVCLPERALAQDPTKVDSAHYKVEFENEHVRVLRITYGSGEKSVMHEHPDAVAVFLTDFDGKMTFADGKTEEISGEAGQTIWTPATKHLPENLGDEPFVVLLVEMKAKPAMKK